MNRVRPMFVFGTRHGTIPNITPSLLSRQNIKGLQLSVGDFWQKRQILKNRPLDMSFKYFLGFSDSTVTYMAPYDFYKENNFRRSMNKESIVLKVDGGYEEVNIDKYNEMAQIILPDYVVSLTELPFDGPKNISHKVASNKSLKFLSSPATKKMAERSKILAPLHIKSEKGELNKTDILTQLEAIISNDHISGLTLCNFCEQIPLEKREETIEFIRSFSRCHNKQYIFSLSGQGKIHDATQAIDLGFDLIEVSWPFTLAVEGLALLKHQDKYITKDPQPSFNLQPLQANCPCFTCKNHSQAYLSHLITSKESNSKLLLSIHNMQRYFQLL